jgi:hypothetical protein
MKTKNVHQSEFIKFMKLCLLTLSLFLITNRSYSIVSLPDYAAINASLQADSAPWWLQGTEELNAIYTHQNIGVCVSSLCNLRNMSLGVYMLPTFTTSVSLAPWVGSSAMANVVIPTIALPGNSFDNMVASANVSINRYNLFAQAFNANAPTQILSAHIDTLRIAMNNFLTEYNASGLNLSVTQADINNHRAYVQANGLYPGELAQLQNSGWSAADIASFQNYQATVNLTISSPTLSLTTSLTDLSNNLYVSNSVPTLSEWALIIFGLSIVLVSIYFIRNKRLV